MVSHVTAKNTIHHPKFRFVFKFTVRNHNIREIINTRKNDENLILHEELFLNPHELDLVDSGIFVCRNGHGPKYSFREGG